LNLNVDYSGPEWRFGLAVRYGLDGPWNESWWWWDLPHTLWPFVGPNQPPIQWVLGHFTRVNST